MRVRSVLTLGLGAAMGATATYLADPEQGARRRRAAMERALQDGRHVAGRTATTAWTSVRAAAVTYAAAAVTGFREQSDAGGGDSGTGLET